MAGCGGEGGAGRQELLEQVHEMAGQIDLGALRDAPISLHAATEAWIAGGSI